MRRLAVLALVVAACTSNGATTTTIDPVPPPPSPEGSTTTTEQAPPPTLREPATAMYSGAFPDGVPYDISIEGVLTEEVTGISGVVMYESSAGAIPAAETVISLTSIGEYEYGDGVYRVPGGGDGSFVLRFYDDVLDELGPDAQAIIRASISGNTAQGAPVLILDDPFRWAIPEDQLPIQMQVMYESFVVQKGCDEIAVACNTARGAQVIASDRVASPAPPFEGENVFINSPAPRLRTDPNYLDPGGQLPPVHAANVLWTGEEMVVWGGAVAGSPHSQGARFYPVSDEWVLFDGPELAEGSFSLAVWVGEEMWVITPFATHAGNPKADTWSEIGTGVSLVDSFDSVVVVEDQVYVWAESGIVSFVDGAWISLPTPGFGVGGNPLQGTLLNFGGNLLATGNFNQNCNSRQTSIWTGTKWAALDTARFMSCSTANQSAVVGGELILWSDRHDPTYRYSVNFLKWEEDGAIPSSRSDGPSGALVMGDSALVPGFDESAIYRAATRSWTEVELPGFANDNQMVWTGAEVLAWTGNGFFGDAWRWTPPE